MLSYTCIWRLNSLSSTHEVNAKTVINDNSSCFGKFLRSLVEFSKLLLRDDWKEKCYLSDVIYDYWWVSKTIVPSIDDKEDMIYIIR